MLSAIQLIASTNTINFQQQPNGSPAQRANAIIIIIIIITKVLIIVTLKC